MLGARIFDPYRRWKSQKLKLQHLIFLLCVMAHETARALRSPSLARLGRLFLHTSITSYTPRKRPGTRNPLPEEEIQRRVEAIVFRTRKKPKPKDHIDYEFAKVGNYRIKDEKIQKMYKEYLRLYHPELAGDEVPSKKAENGKSKESSSDPANDKAS